MTIEKPVKLYSYQKKVIDAIESNASNSQLISMPTGTGKTITFLAVAKHLNKNTLILVHREELLNQTYEKALKLGFKEDEISLIKSSDKASINKITVAMVQTLARNLHRYDSNSIEVMVIDEAHHATAKSYRDVIEHFDMKEKLLLGFTATPLRGDKESLSDIFESHSFKLTLSEATQLGYICPVHGVRIDLDKSLEDIESMGGDYNPQELEKVVNCPAVNKIIVDRCENLGHVPSIVFCTSVNHAVTLAKMLRQSGKKAISISHKTPKKTIARIFKMLKEFRIDFVTNAVKLSEGFDFPPIKSVILARPTRSPVLYKQMIGRGLRKYKDKTECLVIEFSGNDEKMINWEDIDENCTFQTVNINKKVTKEDALIQYKKSFIKSNIKIDDVRVSPFSFYECRISRVVKVKKLWFYTPHDKGFTIFKIVPDKDNHKMNPIFGAWGWICFWIEKYKSFYVWSQGSLSGNSQCTYKNAVNHITNVYAPTQGLKWYPSDEEPMTAYQKSFLKAKHAYSARKAEFLIEDMSLKKAMKQFFFTNKINEPVGVNGFVIDLNN